MGIGIDIGRLADPAFFAQGRLEARSDHRWFASAAEAASGSSSFEVSLDGVWKFAYAKNPALAVDGFQDPDYDVSQWDDIPVPAHIQLQGYDLPQYVNVQYPWDGHEQIAPGRVPRDCNPVASYVRGFTLPGPRPTASGSSCAWRGPSPPSPCGSTGPMLATARTPSPPPSST